MSRSTRRQEESGDRLGIITSVIEVLDADGEDGANCKKELWSEKKGFNDRMHSALGMYSSWLYLL